MCSSGFHVLIFYFLFNCNLIEEVGSYYYKYGDHVIVFISFWLIKPLFYKFFVGLPGAEFGVNLWVAK